MMLYILCLAAVALCSASNPRSSLATRAAQVALELNEHLDSKYYYKLEGFSHVCELPGQDQTTVVIFLTLTRTVCSLQKIKKGMEWTRCPEADKRKYLHCALTELHVTGQSNKAVGFVCERGAQSRNSTFFRLNNNCSDLEYASTPDIVRVKLPPESRPWKEELPIYAPPQCKWMSYLGLFICKKAKERTKDKGPKNPLGRQGISGRGKFPHLGENAFLVPVIVRKENGTLQIVAQQGSRAPFGIPLLNEPFEPGSYSYPIGENLTAYLQDMWQEGYRSASDWNFLTKLNEEKIYAGPINDKHNTDNAWISIYISVMDDLPQKFMTTFPSASGFFWKNIKAEDLKYIKTSLVDVKGKRSPLADLCFKLLD